MAKSNSKESQERIDKRSLVGKLVAEVKRRPVATLAIAAGIGALAGAELLAAGLAGGAAVLLLQRSDLGDRVRGVVERTSGRIHDWMEEGDQTRVEH